MIPNISFKPFVMNKAFGYISSINAHLVLVTRPCGVIGYHACFTRKRAQDRNLARSRNINTRIYIFFNI